MTEPGDPDGEGSRPRPRPRPGPGVTRPTPAAEPTVEPAAEPTVEPASEPTVEPASEPAESAHAPRHAVSRLHLRRSPKQETGTEDASTKDAPTKDGVDASQLKGSRGRRARSLLIRSVVVLAVAAVVALLLRAYVVQPFYIPSESMEPTLHGCTGCSDDHVLVDKISYRFQNVKAGDIVVFHKPPNADVPDKVLIKRVIATSGQKIQLRKNSKGKWDGKVYVNGLALDESYVNKACPAPATIPLTSKSSWTIPKNEVFVMGDNRCSSEDSRAFGPIKTSSVIGRAVLIIWPLSRFGGL